MDSSTAGPAGQYGGLRPAWRFDNPVYVGEGLTASVAVSDLPDGIRNYHNAGKVQASSDPADMRLQRMLGHLTTLVIDNPKRVLVIGCGAGATAGAVSIEPRLVKETIAEIEPLVPKVVSVHFAAQLQRHWKSSRSADRRWTSPADVERSSTASHPILVRG